MAIPDGTRVCTHPLVEHKLSYLRQTPEIVHFRDYEQLIYEMTLLLAYEVTKDFTDDLEDIDTDRHTNGVQWRSGRKLANKPVIVAVVRSGLVMANALRSVIHTPFLGHIGVFDEPGTGKSRAFMATMPAQIEQAQKVIVADLFIDRGKTAAHTLGLLTEYGIDPANIRFLSLIVSEEGLQEIRRYDEFRMVHVHCARFDTGDDRWMPDFHRTNERLYRTRNRPRKE